MTDTLREPSGRTAIRMLRSRRTWMLPVILIVGLGAALPTIYLSATVDPQGHLSELPLALVVEEQAPASTVSAAETVADALESRGDDTIAFARMTPAELTDAMHADQVAGAVVIPAEFDSSISSLLPGATTVTVPTVTVFTNAGDGGLSSGLVIGNMTPALHAVADALGDALTEGVDVLPAATRALLSEPFDVVTLPFEPLDAHSGLGTSAFYYSLILVLLAFIGASLVGPIVDSVLGFIPGEVGPRVARRAYTPLSRRRTFISKSLILVAAAPLAALAVQVVAASVGVSTAAPVVVWLFSTVAIAAIGTSALAVFAALGPGIGSLVNTLFFVALAMVSSGGIVPLEATPPFVRWLSAIAPFRFVVDGIRSLFYFDGNLAAGLGGAWIGLATWAVAGAALGIAVTTLYGRVPAFSRHPQTTAPTPLPAALFG